MTGRPRMRRAGWIVVLVGLAGAPVLAATASTNNTESTCTTCTLVIDWNPVLDCSQPLADGGQLVDCLLASGPPGCGSGSGPQAQGGGQSGGAQHIQRRTGDEDSGCYVPHSTGTYYVEPLENPPPFGLEIHREDLTEIDRLHFSEDYPEIQWIEIYVDQPDLQAVVHEVTGVPTDGRITLTLNARTVVVETAFALDAKDVNDALVAGLRAQRFDIARSPRYILVRRDLSAGTGIQRVGFESTDDGIVASDIALEPLDRFSDFDLETLTGADER